MYYKLRNLNKITVKDNTFAISYHNSEENEILMKHEPLIVFAVKQPENNQYLSIYSIGSICTIEEDLGEYIISFLCSEKLSIIEHFFSYIKELSLDLSGHILNEGVNYYNLSPYAIHEKFALFCIPTENCNLEAINDLSCADIFCLDAVNKEEIDPFLKLKKIIYKDENKSSNILNLLAFKRQAEKKENTDEDKKEELEKLKSKCSGSSTLKKLFDYASNNGITLKARLRGYSFIVYFENMFIIKEKTFSSTLKQEMITISPVVSLASSYEDAAKLFIKKFCEKQMHFINLKITPEFEKTFSLQKSILEKAGFFEKENLKYMKKNDKDTEIATGQKIYVTKATIETTNYTHCWLSKSFYCEAKAINFVDKANTIVKENPNTESFPKKLIEIDILIPEGIKCLLPNNPILNKMISLKYTVEECVIFP